MSDFQSKVSFIWSVADEILRDDFKRSTCLEVILPVSASRSVDRILEPTKATVLGHSENAGDRGA